MSNNIYQRLNEVRKKVAYVQKTANIDGQYKAVTHDMVTAMVRDSLVEQGIVIIPTQIDGAMHEVGATKYGTKIYRYEALYQITFLNAEDPSDKFEIKLEAHANDHSDKAPGKACSYAVKYAMLKVFNIETGENEESRIEGERKQEQMIEHIKDEMNEFMDAKDSLGIYLLAHSVGQDVWSDVFNSAPAGKKQALKKKLREMEVEGGEVYSTINQAILIEDAGQAAENMTDILPATKPLLAKKLGHEKSVVLGRLLEGLQS